MADQPGRAVTSRSAIVSAKWRAANASTPTGRCGPCSSSGLTVSSTTVLARSSLSSAGDDISSSR